MNASKIKQIAEEIERCEYEQNKFKLFDYQAKDENPSGERSAINVKIEGPGPHIVVYALTRDEINCVKYTVGTILKDRIANLTDELNHAFKEGKS